MIRCSWIALAVTVTLMAAGGLRARADEEGTPPISPDRPGFSNPSTVVPRGTLQLEGGYTYTRVGSSQDQNLGSLLLRVPTGPATEGRIGINSYNWVRTLDGAATGFGDSSIGFKTHLLDASKGYGLRQPSVSLIGETTVPTGNLKGRETKWQPDARLCMDWSLGRRAGLTSNLNYGYPSDGGQRFGQFSGGLSFGYSISARSGTFIEYYGIFPNGKDGPNANYIDGGAVYLPNNDYQLDISAGIGLNGVPSDYFVSAGASRRW